MRGVLPRILEDFVAHKVADVLHAFLEVVQLLERQLCGPDRCADELLHTTLVGRKEQQWPTRRVEFDERSAIVVHVVEHNLLLLCHACAGFGHLRQLCSHRVLDTQHLGIRRLERLLVEHLLRKLVHVHSFARVVE